MTLPTLADIAKELDAWRQARTNKKERIPGGLRAKIVSIVPGYGITKVAKVL